MKKDFTEKPVQQLQEVGYFILLSIFADEQCQMPGFRKVTMLITV